MLFVLFLEQSKSRGHRVGRTVLTVVAGALFLSVPIVWAQTGREMMREHYPVTTPQGQLWLSNPAEARTWQSVFDLIEKHSGKDDYMFVTTWESPPLYALTGRRNPTRFDSIIDVMALSTEEKQETIIRDLRAHSTAVLVHDPDFCFDQRPDLVFSRSCPLLQKTLEKQFRTVMSDRSLQVAVRQQNQLKTGVSLEKLN